MFKLFKDVYDQLPDSSDLGRHRDALSTMVNKEGHERMFSHLYESLTILDSKSGSLLQFNSVLVAVFTIFLSTQSSLALWIFGGPGLILTLVSCYILLSVVWVHWSATEHMSDGQQHELRLLEVRRSRTISYRVAWNCSRAGICALGGLIVHVAYLAIPR